MLGLTGKKNSSLSAFCKIIAASKICCFLVLEEIGFFSTLIYCFRVLEEFRFFPEVIYFSSASLGRLITKIVNKIGEAAINQEGEHIRHIGYTQGRLSTRSKAESLSSGIQFYELDKNRI